MKIILVSGDDVEDYGAFQFENSSMSPKEVWEIAKENDGQFDFGDFWVANYEFKDVDPKFIKFIKDYIMDYDLSKDKNFYVVE